MYLICTITLSMGVLLSSPFLRWGNWCPELEEFSQDHTGSQDLSQENLTPEFSLLIPIEIIFWKYSVSRMCAWLFQWLVLSSFPLSFSHVTFHAPRSTFFPHQWSQSQILSGESSPHAGIWAPCTPLTLFCAHLIPEPSRALYPAFPDTRSPFLCSLCSRPYT